MGKATLLLGTGIITLLLTVIGTNHSVTNTEIDKVTTKFVSTYENYENDPYLILDTEICMFENVVYIKENEDIILDFDTSLYLPLGFNAYEGMKFDVSEIEYEEIEEEIVLGFDTKEYLPKDFNPYAKPELKVGDIEYIEDVEEIVLGFDTNLYLPTGFTVNSK